VISDRWPLNRIRLKDGPRLQNIPGTESRPFATWLGDREFAYYEAMLPPELVVVLRVSPDVAAVRRTEDPPDFVRRRATEVREADWNGLPALIVDADQDLETVLREVRTAVWNLL
jgi:hypothetical protein